MSIFSKSISVAENEVQDMLKDLSCLQVNAAKENVKVRDDINKRVDDELSLYKINQKKMNTLQKLATYFGIAATILLTISLGLGALGVPVLLAIVTDAGAVTSSVTGSLKIGVGQYQSKMADNTEIVGIGQSTAQYTVDRDNDISSKTRDTYEILSNLTQAFNRQAMVQARALQRRV